MAMVWRIVSNLIVLALMAVAGYLLFMMFILGASMPTPPLREGTLSLPTAIAPADPAPVVEAPVADPAPVVEAPSADPTPVVETPTVNPAPAP